MKKVNLRCHPYRGILKEMSDELNMPVDRVQKALFLASDPNPTFAEIFNRKVAEREQIVKTFRKNLKRAM